MGYKYVKQPANKPTWRNVLDLTKYKKWIGHTQYAIPIVLSVGYRLFIWNGEVVEISENDTDCIFTGWRVEDLGE